MHWVRATEVPPYCGHVVSGALQVDAPLQPLPHHSAVKKLCQQCVREFAVEHSVCPRCASLAGGPTYDVKVVHPHTAKQRVVEIQENLFVTGAGQRKCCLGPVPVGDCCSHCGATVDLDGLLAGTTRLSTLDLGNFHHRHLPAPRPMLCTGRSWWRSLRRSHCGRSSDAETRLCISWISRSQLGRG